MTNFRKFRYELTNWISDASWQWHLPAIFFAVLAFFNFPKSLWLLLFPAGSIILIILQIYLRRGFRQLNANAQHVDIDHINDRYVLLKTALGAPQTLSREDIEKVTFYKADEITTDLLWCEIEFRKSDRLETIMLHEDCAKFAEFEEWIEELPSFDADWRAKVVLPPFEKNLTVAYTKAVAATETPA